MPYELIIKNSTIKVEAVEILKDGLCYRITGNWAKWLIKQQNETSELVPRFINQLHRLENQKEIISFLVLE